uniref:Uncharacterized protein n=1 Tax=Crocodylus porosus TaxID=8502 RepID=A0A7M4FS16_CROPO
MPEGPSVRKFQLLTSPFVGQVVAKAGGSSRQISLNELQGLELQDSQVSRAERQPCLCMSAQPQTPAPFSRWSTGLAITESVTIRHGSERLTWL